MIRFRCIGIGNEPCEAHNAAMFSGERGIRERYDKIAAQDVKDFCAIGKTLYQFSDSDAVRRIHKQGNVIAIVQRI